MNERQASSDAPTCVGVQRRAWYVLHTKPMSEDKVCKQFELATNGERRLPAKALVAGTANPELFCPKIRSMSTLRGGSDAFQYKPLFPSYVFLRWDLSDPVKHRLVKYTRGVNKVLGDGENPVPISDKIVEIIKERTNSGGIIEQQTYKVGDQIKVRRGLLRDLIGILERPVSDNGRVAVLLRLFNREARAHLRCADIAKA